MYKIVYDKNTKQVLQHAEITAKLVAVGVRGDSLAVANVDSIPVCNAGQTLYYENGKVVVKG